ncbi:hypothetical protein DES53_101610 [Roseimicrobium gellanilyticum]|uniref:Uncharacterized protein n=1 Tax=Roseimicrobium gellanilyticum TaxID=748857 RepID=A0A366HVB7_9BACT|nr:hypothetical protein [Roseimicrobium gellanilyticum]RBP47810.1 hypothetical protein DES53_101610 [Roseimicrobium gellanilyticum]
MPDTPEEIALRQKALEFNQNSRTSPALTNRTTPQDSLDTVLSANTTVKYSDSGAGGAILVMPGQDLAVGAAIKIESSASVKVAEKCSNVMENFFQNATGPAPFVAPRITVYRADDFNQDPNLQEKLGNTMDELKNDANTQKRWGFERAREGVEKVTSGNTAVLMMEFADGVQVNKLPIEERAALVRSEAFAQNLGRAMAPTMALGLTDHAGANENQGLKANISNFMYSPKTGTLSVIDYDSTLTRLDANDPNKIRIGNSNVASNVGDMRTFLEKATQSPEAFEKALDDMVSSEKQTPFTSMMKAFTEHSFDGMFGLHERVPAPKKQGKKEPTPEGQAPPKKEERPLTPEGQALRDFSQEERKQFAANLLVGAIDGLEYMQKNQQALENAVNQTHEVDENGQKVEHFYNGEQMDALKQELTKVDAPTLKTNIGQCIDARNLAQRNDLVTYIADLDKKTVDANNRLSAVQAKIDSLKEHPSAGDRLKTLFSSKEHSPMQKLENEKQKIKEELALIADVKGMAQSKLDYQDQMQLQAKIPPIPQLPPPPLPGIPGNTNVNTTTTTLTDSTNVGLGNSGQQQGVPPPRSDIGVGGHRSLRDLHPELDHSHGTHQGESQGLKTGEKSPKLNDSSGHHSLREDHPEFAKHLSQSRDHSQSQSQGPHVKQ